MRFLIIPLLMMLTRIMPAERGHDLVVVIRNIRSDQGKVGAAIYSSEKDFMTKITALRSATAKTGGMEFVFENLPAGEYAISALHDLNGNDKMDTNWLGIPKDGFGFSNDALGAFGPPGFKKASFKIPQTGRIVITMKYF